MSILDYWNTKVVDNILPSIKEIKTTLLNEDQLWLPCLSKEAESLKQGTVNIFASWKGTGFGIFLNTLLREFSPSRQRKTLILSDVILKNHIYDTLRCKDENCNTSCIRIYDNSSLDPEKIDVDALSHQIVKGDINLLMVYPFLLSEDAYTALLVFLKQLAEKHDLIVVANVPLHIIEAKHKSKDFKMVSHILKFYNPVLCKPQGIIDENSKDVAFIEYMHQPTNRNSKYKLNLNTAEQVFEAFTQEMPKLKLKTKPKKKQLVAS